MAVVSMSDKEFARLDVLLTLEAGRIRTADACTLLGLQRRQVFRLLRGFRERGAVSLLSSRRGRPSNNRLPEAVRELAIAIVRERYADFGPTLACEKLSQLHGCRVSRETLRQWMIAEVDDRRRLVARPASAAALGASAPQPTRSGRRAGPDRRFTALLVREPRAGMHADRLC
jgi:hypothetical protein